MSVPIENVPRITQRRWMGCLLYFLTRRGLGKASRIKGLRLEEVGGV